LLVVMAIVAGAMLLGIPAIQNLIVRSRTEGFAREASVLMQRTRLEAIKMNRDGVVRTDAANRRLEAFLDADGDGTFNPNPAAPPRTADYVLGRLALPANVEFAAPDSQALIDGFTGAEQLAVFQANGSVADEGAFRIGDARGNFLEVRVGPPATGRVQLQKWQNSDWRAAGDPASPDHKPWKWH
jgi:hypothetical protein